MKKSFLLTALAAMLLLSCGKQQPVKTAAPNIEQTARRHMKGCFYESLSGVNADVSSTKTVFRSDSLCIIDFSVSVHDNNTVQKGEYIYMLMRTRQPMETAYMIGDGEYEYPETALQHAGEMVAEGGEFEWTPQCEDTKEELKVFALRMYCTYLLSQIGRTVN